MADPLTPSSRAVSVREDCWSDEASLTLIEAWGRRYVELNRGNLRQKDWQEVCDVVNARHGDSRMACRTDVQCKNRIDTIKKRYKVEKARVVKSGGVVRSLWPFYDRLDVLIGSSSSLKKQKPFVIAAGGTASESLSVSRSPPMALRLMYRKSAPFATAVLPKKRHSPEDDAYFRRNYAAAAAAAAAASTEVEEEEEGDVGEGSEDGIRNLARAIKKFGEVYEKVEVEKQKQIIEIENQRMQLAKDLEVERMQMFVNMQLQLKKISTAKRNKSSAESDRKMSSNHGS